MNISENNLYLGIDVGSTTVKAVVLDDKAEQNLYSVYLRHNARQTETVLQILLELERLFPLQPFQIAVCGSGGKPIAETLKVPYIQEVVANAAIVCHQYPQVRTAIELGGQDAKVIFFHTKNSAGQSIVSDMRMNGSCAGGTGAFIDEIASLLNVPVEEFSELAAKGSIVYDISGRCGVFAKTDIQPLLIRGAAREDIALSTYHAIAKQTIGGLSQGLELKAPIILEGGPFTFHPMLVSVFAERLQLNQDDSDIVLSSHPETIVAHGAAIAMKTLFSDDSKTDALCMKESMERLQNRLLDSERNIATALPFFQSQEEYAHFMERHKQELFTIELPQTESSVLRVYFGIDSGSTTSKIVMIDENERMIGKFYANNCGEPIKVVRKGFSVLQKYFRERNYQIEVLGVGTTGYGEDLFARAFSADYHTVETVAHAMGCRKYIPDASFILDIGGQDMKAIWLKDGIITNIMLNEACSSGCGSFLENFAENLQIPVKEISEIAFSAQEPAVLGSRCTVFMNSTIIHAQRCGKAPADIMAGLCRSIIENVFTKVVRISNPEELGNTIVVQGGTFQNFAVLRALEEYLGKEVILAPYPGEMGAIGAALGAKQFMEKNQKRIKNFKSGFIGLEQAIHFCYQKESAVSCPHCTNHCSLTVFSFPSGKKWINGNRCQRGAAIAEENCKSGTTDLFDLREKLLLQEYSHFVVSDRKNITIGLPRVLEFWESMPFWKTFFLALGFDVKISRPSSQKMYEKGLPFVASDTICFPAKLVHGHMIDLVEQNVDRIFMPYIMHMPPEGTDKNSPYVCSVVMGYPMVVKNSQDPEKRYGVPFDTPIFHWFDTEERKKQICNFAITQFGVGKRAAEEAFHRGESAMQSFRRELCKAAKQILDDVREKHGFAVVLAGRPYHNDPLIQHQISHMFSQKGIPVLTVDSLPELNETDVALTRTEITNNFHTRMLSGAIVASKTPELEYVQIVSFGCGHDAILSDEIVRIMTESGRKPPLILKLDESNAVGAFDIRVRSFIETVSMRRQQKEQKPYEPLKDPYPAKFKKTDRKKRTLLIPNISEEVSILLGSLLEKEHYTVKTLPLGSVEQIRIGKKYTHNDICFPCQMVIGELIDELQKGNYEQDEVAVGMVKFQCDCRMANYAALLRKGLDNAGFEQVPILTTDIGDSKNMHHGVSLLSVKTVMDAVWIFMMMDLLKELCRKIRPYEVHQGETDEVYFRSIRKIGTAIQKGISSAKREFQRSVQALTKIPYDRMILKPRVLVTGELLVTYHPGSNFEIEKYLEQNGMEAIFPRVTDQLRKDFLATLFEIRDYNAKIFPYPYAVDALFDHVQKVLEKIASIHPLWEKGLRPRDIYEEVQDIIPSTLSCGEGWLMAAEIAHYAKEGVRSFIILQPFGCLPNHICGRGVIKKLKEEYPHIQILPLDLDPDTSFANVENRLQMLIMNNLTE